MILDPCTCGVLTNAAGNLLSEALKTVANCVGKRICISNRLDVEDYPKILEDEARKLQDLVDNNAHKVSQNKAKTISSCYFEWLESVHNILQELEQLKAQCENRRNVLVECVIGSKHSKKVRNIRQRVQTLLDNIPPKPPERVVKLLTSDIEDFHTLQGHLEEILDSLFLDQIFTIVICGLPGVGKTTIMKNLNNHENVAKIFDIVIWIKVSEERTTENLQMDIARRLGIDVEGTTGHPNRVTRSISDKLEHSRYLLLLDDVMVDIDHTQLRDIGIPDNDNGSKVVVTTRKLEFCYYMDRVKRVEIKQLTPDESLKMFKQIAADHKIDRGAFKKIAQQVAGQCGGLPQMITVVARNLRIKSDVCAWKTVLEKLKKGLRADIRGLSQIHNTILKCSYDELKNEKQKKCFLYSALHPADTEISKDYLVKCWAAERLLCSIDDQMTFNSTCNEGYGVLEHLTEVSLLHIGKSVKHVQVPCMMRQVALHIISEDPCRNEFLIAEVGNSNTSQNVECWQQVERIYMIDKKLVRLPDKIRSCNMLLSLFLQKNPGLKSIPPEFFNEMPKLRVLNLYKTGIESLPPELQCLTELKALFLNGCTSLTGLPLQIGLLPVLEVLDIRGCKVIFVPTFIGELVHLRCLRLSYYKPAGRVNGSDSSAAMETNGTVISRLHKLEELVIDVKRIDGCDSYDQWCIEATHVIPKIAWLQNLNSLQICFPKLENLQTLLDTRLEWCGREPLSSFESFVGRPVSLQIPKGFDDSIKRYLRYCNDGSDCGPNISNRALEMDALELIGHNKIEYLSDFVQDLGLNRVICCLVEECSKMVSIVDGTRPGGTNILASLEHLHLKNLDNLTSIFKSPLSAGSLSKLHTIVVNHCISLREIFSNDQIQELSNLKELIIQDCCQFNELIVGGSSMQNLEVLELHDMSNLRTISTSESPAWPKLRELRVYNCPELIILPFNETNARKLKRIKGEQRWWDGLSKSNREFKSHFQRVGILRLSD